jgi:S1-C subfamily serine protease
MRELRYGLFLWFWIIIGGLVVGALPREALAGERIDTLRHSVVRIYTVAQNPDYLVPWAPGNNEEGWGTGFIISDNRILTNAHVVGNARFISH